MQDAFTNLKRVTKSCISAANAPEKINVQEGQQSTTNGSKATIKHGRPLGSKYKNPQKRKGAKNKDGQIKEIIIQEKCHEGNEDMTQEKTKVPNSSEDEISLNYVMSEKFWNRDKVIIDDAFAYNLVIEVMDKNEDKKPHSIEECKEKKDWPQWNDAIQAELNYLVK